MKTINHRVYFKAIDDMNADVNDRRIKIYDGSHFKENKAKVVVNWSAIGSVSPDEALEFASKLTKAAEMAKSFNEKYGDCEIIYDNAE